MSFIKSFYRILWIKDTSNKDVWTVRVISKNLFDIGNHGLGYVSVPPISPYGNALPLSEEASTTMTPSMAPTTTHKPWQLSTVSSATSATTQVHTSTTSELKMDSHSNTVTMPTVKSDTVSEIYFSYIMTYYSILAVQHSVVPILVTFPLSLSFLLIQLTDHFAGSFVISLQQ